MTGHVQTTLDGADRRLEGPAHLLERTAADVENDQRRAVDLLEPLQAVPDLGARLIADERIEWSVHGRRRVLEHLWRGALHRGLAAAAVDRHAHRDLPQPADEA